LIDWRYDSIQSGTGNFGRRFGANFYDAQQVSLGERKKERKKESIFIFISSYKYTKFLQEAN
jgi:hypothetical protein